MKDNNNLIGYRNKLIETFKAFDQFCEHNSIKYFAAYGTLIGAVRHRGVIPWDDDIDVWMLPDDYNKFCSLRGKVGGHYDIMDSKDNNYWLFTLAKFVDTNTTLWETEHFPCITGVYIDIFLLTKCESKDAIRLRKRYDKITYSLTYAKRQHSWNQYVSALVNRRPRQLYRLLKDTIYYKPQYHKLLSAYNNFICEMQSLDGDCYVSFDGLYGKKEVYAPSWFSKTKRVPFEGVEITIPENYHAILRNLYGNYMELPPIEKQISHHSHYFMDLDRRWTINEIKEYKKTH